MHDVMIIEVAVLRVAVFGSTRAEYCGWRSEFRSAH
jgi:hypothetical protein